MIIGINCIGIDPEYSGGINSFTTGLLDAFARIDTNHRFNIFITKYNKLFFNKYSSIRHFQITEVELPSKRFINIEWKSIKFNSAWIYKNVRNIVYRKQMRFIDNNCNILYTPTTTLFSYNSHVVNVLSMHDIQQVHFPYFFSKLELLIRKITYYLSAKNVDFIQTSSNYITEDFLKYFSFLKREQLVCISEGVDIDNFKTSGKPTAVLNKYNLPDKFVFFPAQLWHHKNHITLLKALLWIKEEKRISIPLILTGAKYSSSKDVFDFIEKNKLNNVFYLGKIPFEDIIRLYQCASFLITTSLHESSCLPILEAAAAGVPIIASDISPNIEMSKNICMNLFPVKDYVALGELILKLWNDNKLISEQVKSNLVSIEKYSWNNVAKKYLTLFEKIYEN